MKAKALFLLTIFLLNTLMGFGCALLMDIEPESLAVDTSVKGHDHNSHQHGGNEHEPDVKKTVKGHDHKSHQSGSHEHDANIKKIVKVNSVFVETSGILPKDPGCCQDEANKFSTLIKSIPPTSKIEIKLPVLNPGYQYCTELQPISGQFFRAPLFMSLKEHPPSSDLRIIIQSFLI